MSLEAHIHELETALEGAADARATAEEQQERLKQTFSALVVHYRGEGKGVAEAEHFARSSEEYRAASDKWIVANYEYRRTDAKAEGKRQRFEAWRTINATERAKMNLR